MFAVWPALDRALLLEGVVLLAQDHVEAAETEMLAHGEAGEAIFEVPDASDTNINVRSEDFFPFHILHKVRRPACRSILTGPTSCGTQSASRCRRSRGHQENSGILKKKVF